MQRPLSSQRHSICARPVFTAEKTGKKQQQVLMLPRFAMQFVVLVVHAVKNSNDLFLHENNHQNPVEIVMVDREKQLFLVEHVVIAGHIHETFVFMNTEQQTLGKMCFYKTIFCDNCLVIKTFRSEEFVSHLKGIKTKVDDTVVEPSGAFQ